jgi:hypothetical protein
MIYGYQKHIDDIRTVEIVLPRDTNLNQVGTELATVSGTTYVFLPDTSTLPPQPPEIAVQPATLTDALRESIKVASPHVWLINQRVVDMIRQRYSVDDEIKMLRIAPSDETTAYNAYVEECRAWGRGEKAKLGL